MDMSIAWLSQHMHQCDRQMEQADREKERQVTEK